MREKPLNLMSDLSDDQFYEALNNVDCLGLVVRGHLHIEHWVERFLFASMPEYKSYSKEIAADYQTKVLLCCAMGLSANLKAPLISIGNLRNRFAHRPNYDLSTSDVNDLYASLSGTHQRHLKEAYKILAERFSRKEKTFSKLESIERLNLLFMLIRSKLKKANTQIQNNS